MEYLHTKMKTSHPKSKHILVNLLLLFFAISSFNRVNYAQDRIQTEHQATQSAPHRISKYKSSFQIHNELCKDASDRFPIEAWQNLLDQVLDQQGQVNYTLLQTGPLHLQFQALVNTIYHTKIDLDPSPCTQLAYWINTYNVLTIKQVLDYPNLTSVATAINKAPRYAFFKQKQHIINQKTYSLDDIEHRVIRAKFKEPRIHFALNCASQSCPRLHHEPYRASDLNRQLEKVSRHFINDPKRNRAFGQVWQLSKIFFWYKKDFQSASKKKEQVNSVQSFIEAYLDASHFTQIKTASLAIKIEYLEYDWSLNGESPK
ncbi:MAG: hypothetical protein CMH49_04550 [Myxococcales bacterium]|nr:hypothetical protein [Myxococcales bacterium]